MRAKRYPEEFKIAAVKQMAERGRRLIEATSRLRTHGMSY